MISKVLIIGIIGLIIHVIRNISKTENTQKKAQNRNDNNVIDAEYKVVQDDDKKS
tara:strand:+ start:8753 stop:8917 length:165 start_codon:yes stop_codon:yes gene_type:complete